MGIVLPMATMGEIIREARKRKKWSQQRLADEVGCVSSYIPRIEKGQHISLPLLEAICSRLDLPFKGLRRLNDVEFMKQTIGKLSDPLLKDRLFNALAEETDSGERFFCIHGHFIKEDSEESQRIKKLLNHPEKFTMLETELEEELLAEVRKMDDGRKSFTLELIRSLPKKSSKK